MKVGRYTVEISKEDKVLFPKAGITKRDLIDYYRDVAEYMLPHLRNRPVTMHRFPNGVAGESFYQKQRPDYFPDWIDSCEVEKEGGTVDTVMINNAATLVYLANQATEPHIWLSRSDQLDHPDKIIFDLDPSGRSFDTVVEGARRLRSFLDRNFGLVSYPMLTGSEGIHVVIPLRREKTFDEVRDFARKVSEHLADKEPERFTVEMRKSERGDRLFLDYLRNAYAQTGIAPYAVRAREKASVATPVEWEELGRYSTSQAFTIESILDRLSTKGDPWQGIMRRGQSLNKAMKELQD